MIFPCPGPYRADVWLNGRHLGQHEGGYDPFRFDVTDLVKRSGNRLTVRVHDDPHEAKPRGKQSPVRHPEGCTYMRVTGIWQTVWLERTGKTFVRDWVTRADPQTGRLEIRARCDGPIAGHQLQVRVRQDGKELAIAFASCTSEEIHLAATVPNAEPWSPQNPQLYDLEFRLCTAQGEEVDRVGSYVGFRRIEARDGILLRAALRRGGRGQRLPHVRPQAEGTAGGNPGNTC